MALAGRAQWSPVPLPADVRGTPYRPSALGLVPSGTGFHRVHVAGWEYLGAAVGRKDEGKKTNNAFLSQTKSHFNF